MVTSNLDLTYTIVWSLAIANVLGALLCLLLAGQIARLTTFSFALIAPFMITVISFAAFQATRDIMDLWALLVFGVIGIFMKRLGWSRPALLIGFVLAPQAEAYLSQAVQFYGWSMLTRPGVMIMAAIIGLSLYFSRSSRVDEHVNVEMPEDQTQDLPWPQLGFAIAGLLLLVYAIYDGLEQSFLGGIFPIGVAVAILPLMAFVVYAYLFRTGGRSLRFDAERTSLVDDYRLGWAPAVGMLASLYVVSSLIGFVAGVIVFFVVFLRFWAGAKWMTILVMTLLAAAMLAGFGRLLTLEYPSGLLQTWLATR